MRFKSFILAAAMLMTVILPWSAYATSETGNCTQPTVGHQRSFFTTTLSRNGNQGTAVIKLNDGIKLCNDQELVFESFNISSNWDGVNVATAFPQTEAYATHFTFGKNDTVKTVTVQTPEVCKNTQLDIYVGDDEIASMATKGYDNNRIIRGVIFKANGTCETTTTTTTTETTTTPTQTVTELPVTGPDANFLITLPMIGLAVYLAVKLRQDKKAVAIK